MLRSRLSAAGVAIGLVAVSIFAGVTPASAAPAAPTIDALAADMPDTAFNLTGTADAFNTLEVYVDNVYGNNQTCFTSTAAVTTWSCAMPALPAGSNTITVRAYVVDPADYSTSAPVTVTVYTTTPITVDTSPAAITPDSTPGWAGHGPIFGVATVLEGAATLCSAAIDITGNWECSVDTTQALAAGLHTPISVRGVDFGGGITYAYPGDVTVGPMPAPTVNQDYPAPWITDAGTAQATQGTMIDDTAQLNVEISADGVTYLGLCSTTYPETGYSTWSCAPGVPFFQGTNYVRAQAVRFNGDVSPWSAVSVRTVVNKPTVDLADGIVTNDTTPTFSGTATGSTVSVIVQPEAIELCNALIVGGTWSCTSVISLPDDVFTYIAYIDPGPSTQSNETVQRSITVDTVAPAAPAITSASTSTNSHPLVTGTAEPNVPLTLYLDGAPAVCSGGAITADASGNWSCQLSGAPLAVGSAHTLGAVQTDIAGNISEGGVPSVAQVLTIVAAVAPVVPVPTPTPSPTATPLPAALDVHLRSRRHRVRAGRFNVAHRNGTAGWLHRRHRVSFDPRGARLDPGQRRRLVRPAGHDSHQRDRRTAPLCRHHHAHHGNGLHPATGRHREAPAKGQRRQRASGSATG